MNVLLFEDEGARRLEPVTLARPAFAIACGSYRLADLAEQLGDSIGAHVRPHLRALVAADFPKLSDGRPPHAPLLLVNARLVPSVSVVATLKEAAKAGRPMILRTGGSVAAAVIGRDSPLPDLRALESWDDYFDQLRLPTASAELPLFEYPHDILRHHPAALAANIEHRLAVGGYKEIADGVFAAAGATLGAYCVTDSKRGPIVLEAGATVGPYCLLSGPAHIGAGARVLEHAAIKDGVALGHTTKIGGEVEASIIEPYTNKQHHGFLGHSYLGSWINLGAGTCNSDLKNTYGQVNMQYRGEKIATGMQFVGAIVGDYAKTAINTGIFTGKTIGVCSMVYGFVTTNVPSFVNYARLFGQVTEAPVSVMASTQRRMFARRGVEQRPCDVQLLADMYELTRHDREAGGQSISIEPLSL